MKYANRNLFRVTSLLLLLAVCATSLIASAADKTAREYIRQIQADATKAYKAKDYRTARDGFAQWHTFAPNHPAPIYNLACVEALLGNKEDALRWLDLYARMGQVADLAKDPDLASLTDSAEFKQIADRMKQAAQTVQQSSSVAPVHNQALVEDVTLDSRTHSYYLSSLLDKRIVKISRDKKLTEVADLSKDPGWPVFAIALHPGAKPILWVAAAAMPDFVVSPQADAGKSLLLKIGTERHKILERIAPPSDGEPHVLGDLAIAPDGTIVVSDGLSGAVYLLKPGTRNLRRIDAGQFVSPQTPAFLPDHRHVFVADYSHGIARIDLQSGTVDWLKAPPEIALTGIDGLYFDKGSLIAVQNGTTPTRIVRLLLARDLASITGLNVITTGVDAEDINHGVIDGSSFTYITHAGWDALDGKGNRKPDAKRLTPELRRIHLNGAPAAPAK